MKRLIALLAALAVSLGLCACGAVKTEKISAPFEYAGYSEASYRGYTKTSQYVEMSDGVKLAVDIYLPGSASPGESFPVILQYTPYGRAYVLPDGEKVSLIEKLGMWYYTGTAGRLLDRLNSHDSVYGSSDEELMLFLSHGYAYVCADMRGCGASTGHMVDFMPEFASDGKELINWLAEQNWCDGNVGMFGGSYLGYSQLVTAAQRPEALKCIIPEVVPLDGYTGEMRPGGIMLWSYSTDDMQYLLETNVYSPDDYSYPTAPVVDEDGDGSVSDEVPLDLNGDGDFTNDYNYPEDPNDEPQYADGDKREHIYYLATLEHKQNVPYNELGPSIEYIDTEFRSGSEIVTAYTASPAAGLSALAESGIPIYAMGGWMDAFTRGTTEIFCTLQKTNPVRLLIGAGYHEETSPYWEYCGEKESEMIAATYTEKLRFYDRWLKGIDNGIDTEDPILIYNMNGDGWRTESEWPLARQQQTEFYFSDNNRLSSVLPNAGMERYTVDFTTSNQYGTKEIGARYQMATPDTLPVRTEEDKKCLCYTADPFDADTEVTGTPIVEFWVTSTAATGDFFAYLEDVDADGKAVLITEGQLSAQFANEYNNDRMANRGNSGIDILPDLPWHGYEQAQEVAEPFAGGKIVRLHFDLCPTSWTFKAGHSVRVSIACADFPTFELTPELCPNSDLADISNIIPEITVYHDAKHCSSIMLPIIP